MFVIFRGNRPQGNKKHQTYEKARQALRKLLRKKLPFRGHGQPIGVTKSLPFSYTEFGYNIRKV